MGGGGGLVYQYIQQQNQLMYTSIAQLQNNQVLA